MTEWLYIALLLCCMVSENVLLDCRNLWKVIEFHYHKTKRQPWFII